MIMLIDEINEAINTKIKPLLAEHNGDIRLIKEDDGIVQVELLGSCSRCPSAKFTMEELVEEVLLDIPGVKNVKLVEQISSDILEFARQLLNR